MVNEKLRRDWTPSFKARAKKLVRHIVAKNKEHNIRDNGVRESTLKDCTIDALCEGSGNKNYTSLFRDVIKLDTIAYNLRCTKAFNKKLWFLNPIGDETLYISLVDKEIDEVERVKPTSSPRKSSTPRTRKGKVEPIKEVIPETFEVVSNLNGKSILKHHKNEIYAYGTPDGKPTTDFYELMILLTKTEELGKLEFFDNLDSILGA